MGRLPARPDEAVAQRRPERRWIPVLLVTALILLITQGARAVADATAGPAAPVVTIGSAVALQPRPGWDIESVGADEARLHRGPVILDVFVRAAEPGGASAVAQRFVDGSLRQSLAEIRIGEWAPASLAGGVPAVRFGYVGTTFDGVAVDGIVIAASGSTGSVVFDAYGPQDALLTVGEDLRVMIEGAVLR
jgi:hypothetical protein